MIPGCLSEKLMCMVLWMVRHWITLMRSRHLDSLEQLMGWIAKVSFIMSALMETK